MLRVVVRAVANARSKTAAILCQNISETTLKITQPSSQHYHSVTAVLQQKKFTNPLVPIIPKPQLLQNPEIIQISQNIRPLTKFSLKKGKRKTVKSVLKRFYRLDWGAWIRTKSGRHKKLWKKSESRKRRLREHVFTNGTQSWLLDKMVTKYWRKPKHYVDDPYEPYHTREEFYITRRKPV